MLLPAKQTTATPHADPHLTPALICFQFGWRSTCLQVKSFDDEASTLALHPSGFLLLAGFADRLRLMTVLSGGARGVYG